MILKNGVYPPQPFKRQSLLVTLYLKKKSNFSSHSLYTSAFLYPSCFETDYILFRQQWSLSAGKTWVNFLYISHFNRDMFLSHTASLFILLALSPAAYAVKNLVNLSVMSREMDHGWITCCALVIYEKDKPSALSNYFCQSTLRRGDARLGDAGSQKVH